MPLSEGALLISAERATEHGAARAAGIEGEQAAFVSATGRPCARATTASVGMLREAMAAQAAGTAANWDVRDDEVSGEAGWGG